MERELEKSAAGQVDSATNYIFIFCSCGWVKSLNASAREQSVQKESNQRQVKYSNTDGWWITGKKSTPD